MEIAQIQWGSEGAQKINESTAHVLIITILLFNIAMENHHF
jgi:hypothetical protein